METNTEVVNVDELLDTYNDYMLLYDMFGDEEFKDVADCAMAMLNATARRRKRKVKANVRKVHEV